MGKRESEGGKTVINRVTIQMQLHQHLSLACGCNRDTQRVMEVLCGGNNYKTYAKLHCEHAYATACVICCDHVIGTAQLIIFK